MISDVRGSEMRSRCMLVVCTGGRAGRRQTRAIQLRVWSERVRVESSVWSMMIAVVLSG